MSSTIVSSIEHHRRRQALAGCGLDPDLAMVRGPSYANEVWLADELVLRVNWRGVGRLAREAAIARRASPEVRYPPIVTVGDDGEIEWMLARRVPGLELGRAWASMTAVDRKRAITELAGCLAALHATPCDGIPDDIDPPHTLPLAELLTLIDELPGDRALLADVGAFLRERWPAFDDADRGLVHGDPHLENVLWDGAHVSAVLDLEWSRPSWIHCDVEILMAVSEEPALFASIDHEHLIDARDYEDVPDWLVAAQPGWFAHPRLRDRLEFLFASRTLGCLDEAPDSALRWQHLRALLG